MVKYFCDRCKEEIPQLDIINRRLFQSYYEVSFHESFTSAPKKIIEVPEIPKVTLCLCNKCNKELDDMILKFLEE